MKTENIDAISWRCPQCEKNHFSDSGGTTTLMYFPPTFKDGVNINPDRNTTSFNRTCLACGASFSVSGNTSDGWSLRLIKNKGG